MDSYTIPYRAQETYAMLFHRAPVLPAYHVHCVNPKLRIYKTLLAQEKARRQAADYYDK